MTTLKQRAEQAFAEVEHELRGISKWMHDNPETAYEEYESSQRLAAFLENRGFDVTYPAYGLDTSFEANRGSGAHQVVICCEYDALPGVGHACGHNIIATSSLGAGAALTDVIDDLDIRLTVLGTPAEEKGGGKIDLIEAGAFAEASASMLIHPSGRNLADPRLLAAQGLTVEYHGRESHAAATPHVGINALDAFVHAYNGVSVLRQQFESGDRVHGVVEAGGTAPNVIPAYTRSNWIIRAETADRFEKLKEKVLACFESAARATGCRMDITPEGEPFMDLISDPVMTELFVANSVLVGRQMPTYEQTREKTYASSDMGNVSHVVPSIHPSIRIDTDAVNHQPEFATATVTPSGQQAIRDGALAMAYTIIDMAEQDLWDQLGSR